MKVTNEGVDITDAIYPKLNVISTAIQHEIKLSEETLRDYFAGKALEGDWASQSETAGHFANISDEGFEISARNYYKMADAMLKARAEK